MSFFSFLPVAQYKIKHQHHLYKHTQTIARTMGPISYKRNLKNSKKKIDTLKNRSKLRKNVFHFFGRAMKLPKIRLLFLKNKFREASQAWNPIVNAWMFITLCCDLWFRLIVNKKKYKNIYLWVIKIQSILNY